MMFDPPDPVGRPDHRREARLVHPRRRGDQPAGPGQRLLDARRPTAPSATRRPVIAVLDRAGAAADRRRRRTAGHRRPLHARRRCRRRSPRRSTRSWSATSRRPIGHRHPGRDPGPRRSPARRAPGRTGTPSRSSATRRSTPPASWCSTPSGTRTSAATAAAGRADLARRDGADPLRPADGAVPAGRPTVGRQHRSCRPAAAQRCDALQAPASDDRREVDSDQPARRRHQPAGGGAPADQEIAIQVSNGSDS